MPWAATKAGCRDKGFNTDTGSVNVIYIPALE